MSSSSLERKRRFLERHRERLVGYNRQFAVLRYGITIDIYNALLEAQGGVCAICHQAETQVMRGRVQSLSVDHDHQTGKVRGLLCNRCNTKLPILENDTYVSSALAYLKRHK